MNYEFADEVDRGGGRGVVGFGVRFLDVFGGEGSADGTRGRFGEAVGGCERRSRGRGGECGGGIQEEDRASGNGARGDRGNREETG